MAIICPNCNHPVEWAEVKSRFKCAECHTSLRSNIGVLMGWIIVLSSLPFALIAALPGWAAAIGLLIGFVACGLIVNQFTSIERDHGENAT